MLEVYDSPKYYDIAFSFRDIAAEVDVCEECIKRFSEIEVKSVFELACGTSPYLEELAKRGYRYLGLDINEEMLASGEQKSARLGIDAKLVHADMTDFILDSQVDFAYILLGSLSVTNASEQESHFNSVASVLKKGGLYLLDWCIQFEPPWQTAGSQTWVLEKENKFVRFHAIQSLATFLPLSIIAWVIGLIPFIGRVISPLIGILALILWLILMFKAYKGEMYKLPVVGDFAEAHTQ